MKSSRWATSRAVIQLILLFVFFVIIIATRYPVEDSRLFTIIPRLSPYLAVFLSISTFSVITAFAPALIILMLTLFLGRFFCGWICPLGATIDVTDKAVSPGNINVKRKFFTEKFSIKSYKYLLLIISLILSLSGIQTLSLIDPLSIAVRSYSLVVYPYLDNLLKLIFEGLYYIPGLNMLSEPIYGLLKNFFLDFNPIQFHHHIAVFTLFVLILLLSLLTRRFWCRSLCPLGAIFALTGRFAPFRRVVHIDKCVNCNKCEKDCRMSAISGNGIATDHSECIKCFDCLRSCKYDATEFKFRFSFKQKKNVSNKQPSIQENGIFTRRRLLGSLLGSIIAIPIFRLKPGFTKEHSRLVRPPGALPEKDFLDKCIRCGECMKVCPTNALHPLLFEYGLEGVFTPHLVPRLGWCEKNCNLCSKVCPSGALENVPIEKKETLIIGTAYIIRDLCIPWSEFQDCLVCEEMCPTKTKSIILRETRKKNKEGKYVNVKLPFVLENLCIGCGICENKCPVQGNAAIQVRTPKIAAIIN